MHYTYLLVDLAAFIVPFLFSFHPKINFHREYKYFFPACLAVAVIFLVCDYFFTQRGIWGFNPDYVSGINLFLLPAEEILFFFCIPYACVFTYHCFKVLYGEKTILRGEKNISAILAVALLTAGILFHDRAYTASTFISLAVLISLLQFALKVNWLGRFYFTYAILLIPFFIVNGILTGTGLSAPVVWYNNNENLGIRLLTIPAEDVFYGMLLALGNVAGMEFLKQRF
jgi:lycopene cyclase domain-containing protein